MSARLKKALKWLLVIAGTIFGGMAGFGWIGAEFDVQSAIAIKEKILAEWQIIVAGGSFAGLGLAAKLLLTYINNNGELKGLLLKQDETHSAEINETKASYGKVIDELKATALSAKQAAETAAQQAKAAKKYEQNTTALKEDLSFAVELLSTYLPTVTKNSTVHNLVAKHKYSKLAQSLPQAQEIAEQESPEVLDLSEPEHERAESVEQKSAEAEPVAEEQPAVKVIRK